MPDSFLEEGKDENGQPCVIVNEPPTSLHDVRSITELATLIGAVQQSDSSERHDAEDDYEEESEPGGRLQYRIYFKCLDSLIRTKNFPGWYDYSSVRLTVRLALQKVRTATR